MPSSSAELFLRVRPRLMAIGYRMLGSVQEAEDLVQDAWLRWHDEVEGPRAAVLNPEAWLVTVVTRLAIDRLRAAKTERALYVGLWLPEPLVQAQGSAPPAEAMLEHCDDLSIAFMLLLERLAPEERAARTRTCQ